MDRERIQRHDREAVSTTETTGAALEDKKERAQAQAQVDTDKIRQDALEQGKAEGKSACEAAMAEEKAKKDAAPADAKKKMKAKEKKPESEEHSMTAPIPTPMPAAQPAPEPTSQTTITSAPMPEGPPPNTSTTLGDSTSGMYTGGNGTYGGKATWGSGAKK